MSIRKQQVESTLKRALATLLAHGMCDPRVRGMVSVTRIVAAPDYSEASVYVSVLPAERQKTTVAGLQHAAGYIRGKLLKAVAMRSVPRLNFRLDESLKKEAAVLSDIASANAAPPQTEPAPDEPPASSPPRDPG
jgi:ribosome-binding factor A